MFVYLLFLLFPLAFALRAPRFRLRDKGFAAFCVLLVFFIGLRHEIGPDWLGYSYILERSQSLDWSAVWNQGEPLFFLLNKASDAFGWGQHGVNAVCAAIFMYGVFRYARTTVNAWLALAAVMPFLVFIIAMSGIRQGVAIGILFVAAASWPTSVVWKKVTLILLAMGFHTSALFMMIFVVWDTGRYQWVRIAIGGVIGFIALQYMGDSGATEVYSKRYFEDNVQSGGALYHVMLCAIPGAIYLAFRRKWDAHGVANGLVSRASVLSIALLPMVFISSTGTSRVSLYLSFVQMWVFPAFVKAHGNRWPGATLVCGVYFLAIFVVYFTQGTHVDAYLPYRNLLWAGWD